MRKHLSILTLALGVFAAVGPHGSANAAVKTAGYVYYTKGGSGESDASLVFSEDRLNYTAVPPAGRQVGNWGWADGGAKAQQYGTVNWEDPSVGDTTYAVTAETNKAAVFFDYIPLTVKFSSNGGTGSMAPLSGQNYDSQFQLSACTFTKPGYHCGGWSNATTGQLSPAATVKGSQFWNAASMKYDATLNVMWAPNTYYVRFDGNGATGGSMPDESFTYDAAPKELSPNAFTKAGFAFIGWATNGAPDKVVYVDRQPVSNLTPDKDGVVMLHACWEKACTVTFYDDYRFGHGKLKVEYVSTNDAATAPVHPVHTGYTANGWSNDFSRVTADLDVMAKYVNNAYTVTFDPNGGTGEGPADETYHYDMYETEGPLPTPTYDPPKNYASFVGWSTNRKDTVGFTVATNLTSEAGGKVKLYAIWTYDVGEWSRVLGCDNLMFENKGSNPDYLWRAKTNDEEDVRIYMSHNGDSSLLQARVNCSGELSFKWKAPKGGINNQLTVRMSKIEGGAEQYLVETNLYEATSEWRLFKIRFEKPEDLKEVYIRFKHGASNNMYLGEVTWIPDSCAIEFDPTGGENAPTNITVDCNSMEYLPEEVPTRLGYEFLGWATNAPPSEVVDYLPGDPYSNGNSTNTVTMYAVWKEFTRVPVPVAASGLVYDGAEKTGVPAGENYSIVGNVAANAGEHVATATLMDGCIWEDLSLDPKSITWTIAKGTKDVSGVTFPDATFQYDGQPHSFGIAGELPEGVSVVYEGETVRTEVGTNTVTASFAVADAANWNAIETTLTARLMIVRKVRPVPADEDLYSDGEIGEFDGRYAATYSGWLRDPSTGAIVAQIQVKATAAKSGRASKSTITVTPLGGKKKSYKTEVWPGGNPMDSFGIVYGASALDGTLSGIPGIPNGVQIEAAKDFAKSKNPAEKIRKSEIPQGCRTLALATADGYDCFSVTIDKNGKAKVKGALTEGVSFSLSVQGALGKDAFAVPVTYSKSFTPKTGGGKRQVTFGFVLWIEVGPGGGGAAWMTNVTGDRWLADGSDIGQAALVRPFDGSRQIVFAVPTGFPQAYLMRTDDGHSLTPGGETITVKGRKWTAEKTVGSVKYDAGANALYVKVNGKPPANLTKLKLSYTEKSGQVKGSFKLYYLQSGKLKTDSAAVTGVAVNGRFIGNAVIKKKGAMPILWQ